MDTPTPLSSYYNGNFPQLSNESQNHTRRISRDISAYIPINRSDEAFWAARIARSTRALRSIKQLRVSLLSCSRGLSGVISTRREAVRGMARSTTNCRSFITTGVVVVDCSQGRPDSKRLLKARVAASRLARELARTECRLRFPTSSPKPIKILSTSAVKKGRRLKVAVTVMWRCVGRHSRPRPYPCPHSYWCPYLYPNCRSCPRRRACPWFAGLRLNTLAWTAALHLKAYERRQRRLERSRIRPAWQSC